MIGQAYHVSHHMGSLLDAIDSIVSGALVCTIRCRDAQIGETLLCKEVFLTYLLLQKKNLKKKKKKTQVHGLQSMKNIAQFPSHPLRHNQLVITVLFCFCFVSLSLG